VALVLSVLGPARARAQLPGGATPPEPYRHAGRWITDATGRVLIPRGVNMVVKLPPNTPAFAGFGEKDAALLSREGFNVVRVGVIYAAVEPAPGVYNDAYLRSIRSTVALLHRYGIMSVIDFHQDLWGTAFNSEGFPQWATLTDGQPTRPLYGLPDGYFKVPGLQKAFDHFWANTPGPGGVGIQDRYAAAWAHTARFLKETPGILGWELLNEPFPGSDWPKFVAPPWDPEADADRLTGFSRRILRAIRTADTNHIVWYEPWITYDLGAPTYHGRLDDPRVGFAFHNYISLASTPWPYIQAVEHSEKTGAALLATEFGAIDDPAVVVEQMNLADRFMMPVIYWAYWDRTPYLTSNGLVSGGYGEAQSLVQNLKLPLLPGNVNEAKLGALVRAFPRAVAGTPLWWSYDPGNQVFELVYRTAAARGLPPLARDAETEIFVPARHYPQGYTAAVTGAKIVSEPHAPLLRLVNAPRAAQVTVRVVPKPGRSSDRHGHGR
jgi:endoglycosylceramidase